MTDRVPAALLLVTRQRWRIGRRWHWEVLNVWGNRWPHGHGYARTFEEARSAASLRVRLGPGGYVPETPDPSMPESWPDVNLIPVSR